MNRAEAADRSRSVVDNGRCLQSLASTPIRYLLTFVRLLSNVGRFISILRDSCTTAVCTAARFVPFEQCESVEVDQDPRAVQIIESDDDGYK
jgi:hypothetical protein